MRTRARGTGPRPHALSLLFGKSRIFPPRISFYAHEIYKYIFVYTNILLIWYYSYLSWTEKLSSTLSSSQLSSHSCLSPPSSSSSPHSRNTHTIPHVIHHYTLPSVGNSSNSSSSSKRDCSTLLTGLLSAAMFK